MKILFALSRFPYPLEKGDKLRAFQQIKGLSKKHDVYLFCINQQKPTKQQLTALNEYCKEICCVKISKGKSLINAAKGFFNHQPFQNHYFSSGQAKKAFTSFMNKVQADVVFSQMVRMTRNIDFSHKCLYYLDYMDALSLNMERRFGHSKIHEKPFVKWEASKLTKAEIQAQSLFDGFSVISDTDKAHLAKHINQDVTVIPNGIDTGYFEYYPTRNHTEKEYDLIFTGNMGYHPNIQACKFLVNQILPNLRRKGLKLRVCLAGARPSKEVKALQSSNVVITGFVDDLKPYLAKSRLFVAPLFSGSGLQNKLLESMAMGLPTLTTAIANSALKADHQNEILVLDEAEKMADEIAFLLKNKEQAEKMGKNGRQYVKNNFSWTVFNDALVNDFERLIELKRTK